MATTENWNAERTELILYADNESSLYGQKKAIIANLKLKIEKGQYSKDLAPTLWKHWLDEAAKKYCKEFSVDIVRTFPVHVRQAAALELAEREYEAIMSGEYGAVVKPAAKAAGAKVSLAEFKSKAKYHTKYEGPTNSRGARIVVKTLSTGKSKGVPYDHAARDAHESALHEVTGSKGAVHSMDDGRSGRYWQVANGKPAAKKAAKKAAKRRK